VADTAKKTGTEGQAATVQTALGRRTRRAGTLVGIIVALAVVGLVIASVIAGHRNAEQEMARAELIKDDIHALEVLHADANAAFLRELGMTRFASSAWPVARAGEATRRYADLERLFQSDPAGAATVRAVRGETAKWQAELDEATIDAVRRGERLSVASKKLLIENDTLQSISGSLTGLRTALEAEAAKRAAETAGRSAYERIMLAISGFIAIALASYALRANHRSVLAREKVKIVAHEAERRFREYFETHPLAMLIYDIETHKILAANAAAAAQYGYAQKDLQTLLITALHSPEHVGQFLTDLAAFDKSPERSGSAGVRRHKRKDGSVLSVEVSYHFLDFANKSACFIVAVDVSAREHAQEALRAAKQMLDTVIDTVPHRIFWKDLESHYLGCNRAFATDVGFDDPAQVVGLTDDAMPWRDSAAEIKWRDQSVLQSAAPLLNFETQQQTQLQRSRWLKNNKLPLFDARGAVTGILGTYEDITDLKDAELTLRLRSRALDAIVNAVLITRTEAGGQLIQYANPAFERITGYRMQEVEGRDCKFLQGADTDQHCIEDIRMALKAKQDVTTLLKNYRKDGAAFWNQLYIAPVPDEHGRVTHHISVINDVTELVESRDMLHRQAKFDALTRLPNRSMLNERLTYEVERGESSDTCVDVIFIDVDHFKDINDSLGHGAGDRLLREIARRLAFCVGDSGLVARYGGDEFVIVLSANSPRERLSEVLEQLSMELERAVILDDIELQIEISMGVASYPSDARNAETLLINADLALYEAKTTGRNQVKFFNRAMSHIAEARIELSRRIRGAFKNKEFVLAYQPQVSLHTGRVTGVEALIRWHDPELGEISPAIFIPAAEENGLIGPIGEWVLREACKQAKKWETVLPGVRMSVNVSPKQFARGDLPRLIRDALSSVQLESTSLELEITEGALMGYGALDVLNSIRAIGVGIAIDDFGTGYSSLAYIRNFRADRLKLDMSFVRGIGVSREDEAITRAILSLGHTLDFEVVAEGVESAHQLAFLKRYGCDVVQGYIFAKPMDAETTTAFIAVRNGQTEAV
jgi:diguanylate cyclase (GGDEF)-like protein/PAS domain S-box-containing protein